MRRELKWLEEEALKGKYVLDLAGFPLFVVEDGYINNGEIILQTHIRNNPSRKFLVYVVPDVWSLEGREAWETWETEPERLTLGEVLARPWAEANVWDVQRKEWVYEYELNEDGEYISGEGE